ncbi:MAG TPA: ABC transporter permease [Candidatus Atribacteria bacterium]|nr:ABC transporter permease [Candidatus Atribacteria bacterium]
MLLSELNPGQRFLLFLGKNWVVFFLLFLCVLFSFTGTGFLSPKTLNNILITSSPALLLAAGETFVIITGGIDLSVGFVMGLCCVISAKIMVTLQALGLSSVTCIAVGAGGTLLLGLLPGLVNGILVAKFRVPPFIATLGIYGVANGFALRLSQGFPITFLPPEVGEIGNGFVAYFLPGKGYSFFKRPAGMLPEDMRNLIGVVPFAFLIALLFILIFAFILSRTPFGQHTYAIGGNIDAARRAGIPVDRHLIKVYMISSFFASLSGVLATLIFSIGAPTQFASSLELFAVAAVVIGGASLMGGKGSMLGTFLGVLVLSVLEIGFLMSGILPFYRYVAVGVTLIIAVLIDQSFPELVYD